MSDLAAAAAAIGAPEELVARSAAARATASGTTAEAILAAWGGGGSAPAPAAPASAEPTPAETEEPEPPASPEPAADVPAPADVPTQTVAPEATSVIASAAPADHRKTAAPLLTGRVDRIWAFMFSVTALFVVGIFFAVGLPAAEGVDIAKEQIAIVPFSDQALTGRDIYEREGCFYCHTQQVRSVVTDVNLGKVSEPGSSISFGTDNFGFQRIGPDLTHVGSREPTNDAQWLENFLTAPRTVHEDSLQPSYGYLSDGDMSALVQYLLELE